MSRTERRHDAARCRSGSSSEREHAATSGQVRCPVASTADKTSVRPSPQPRSLLPLPPSGLRGHLERRPALA